MSINIDLNKLSKLDVLFKTCSNGSHINRLSDPVLWAELERNEDAYRVLLTKLGYELRLDQRGFAWFHSEDPAGSVNRATRQIALLFLVIFEFQANAGRQLPRFTDWIIDKPFLRLVHTEYTDLLLAEELPYEDFVGLMDRAVKFGFARSEQAHWQLLPAAYRYLDHFEALATHKREIGDDLSVNEALTDSADPDGEEE